MQLGLMSFPWPVFLFKTENQSSNSLLFLKKITSCTMSFLDIFTVKAQNGLIFILFFFTWYWMSKLSTHSLFKCSIVIKFMKLKMVICNRILTGKCLHTETLMRGHVELARRDQSLITDYNEYWKQCCSKHHFKGSQSHHLLTEFSKKRKKELDNEQRKACLRESLLSILERHLSLS